VSQLADSDKTFEGFLKECFEAPNFCPVASRADSAEELISKVWKLIDEAKYEPILLGIYGPQSYVSIKTQILGALYAAPSYPTLGLYLDALLTRNETEFALWATSQAESSSGPPPFKEFSVSSTTENNAGIRCSDEAFRSDSLEEIKPYIEAFHEESRIIGDITWSTLAMSCAQWPYTAKETISRPWEGLGTKNPMLVVQNTHDPVLSVEAARNASAAFPTSRLLLNEGYGVSVHCEKTCELLH
jgi:hypothetical protein